MNKVETLRASVVAVPIGNEAKQGNGVNAKILIQTDGLISLYEGSGNGVDLNGVAFKLSDH
jgi:hypothetical protein